MSLYSVGRINAPHWIVSLEYNSCPCDGALRMHSNSILPTEPVMVWRSAIFNEAQKIKVEKCSFEIWFNAERKHVGHQQTYKYIDSILQSQALLLLPGNAPISWIETPSFLLFAVFGVRCYALSLLALLCLCHSDSAFDDNVVRNLFILILNECQQRYPQLRGVALCTLQQRSMMLLKIYAHESSDH